MTQKIIPNLWFDDQAEEAAKFYVSVFGEGSQITMVTHYPANSPGTEGNVMTVEFDLRGEHFVAINGGPRFPFTEAVSLMINCADQDEVDFFWEKLTDGGEEVQCGWLKDR